MWTLGFPIRRSLTDDVPGPDLDTVIPGLRNLDRILRSQRNRVSKSRHRLESLAERVDQQSRPAFSRDSAEGVPTGIKRNRDPVAFSMLWCFRLRLHRLELSDPGSMEERVTTIVVRSIWYSPRLCLYSYVLSELPID